ncbi:hypothetical protein [Streptomyces spinosus]|uniref:hypothetical protein n=1 Tax=Streptomyces spinosus TaxID=2872623 RepID=UPI001CED6D39|nr:hypothetical protein [Streptomyces spinosus]
MAGLRWIYALCVLHRLLIPDTAALAALRQRIDVWGMFPVMGHMIGVSPSPTQFTATASERDEVTVEA